jgi:hypothetical protein
MADPKDSSTDSSEAQGENISVAYSKSVSLARTAANDFQGPLETKTQTENAVPLAHDLTLSLSVPSTARVGALVNAQINLVNDLQLDLMIRSVRPWVSPQNCGPIPASAYEARSDKTALAFDAGSAIVLPASFTFHCAGIFTIGCDLRLTNGDVFPIPPKTIMVLPIV